MKIWAIEAKEGNKIIEAYYDKAEAQRRKTVLEHKSGKQFKVVSDEIY